VPSRASELRAHGLILVAPGICLRVRSGSADRQAECSACVAALLVVTGCVARRTMGWTALPADHVPHCPLGYNDKRPRSV
jgi:hypothetical protein